MALLSAELLLVSFLPFRQSFKLPWTPVGSFLLSPVGSTSKVYLEFINIFFHCHHASTSHCHLLPRPQQQLPSSFFFFCFLKWDNPSLHMSRENVLKYKSNQATSLPKILQWFLITVRIKPKLFSPAFEALCNLVLVTSFLFGFLLSLSSINIFSVYQPNFTSQNTQSLFLPQGLCICYFPSLPKVSSILCCD